MTTDMGNAPQGATDGDSKAKDKGPQLTRRTAVVELTDGRILSARIINPDTLRYEETAHRNGWPGMTLVDGVATMGDTNRRITFETWAALKRTKQYDKSYDQFAQYDCVDIDVSEEKVTPTVAGPGPASSLNSPGTAANHSPNSPELMTP